MQFKSLTSAIALTLAATAFSGAAATPLEDASLAYKIAGCGSSGSQLPSYCNGGGTQGCKCSGIGVYGCSAKADTDTCKSKGFSYNVC